MSVTEITSLEEFNKFTQANKLVCANFGADYCGPCRMITPMYKSYAAEFPSIAFTKTDCDEAEALAEHMEVEAMPTFFFYKEGKQVDLMRGANMESLKAKLEAFKQ